MSFILLYGKPGSGKTTLAASMTHLGYKVHFIDVDRKIDKMNNLKSQIEHKVVSFQQVGGKLTPSTLRSKILTPKIALLTQPKGYLEFVDIIDNLEKQRTSKEPPPPPGDVLVIDSLTSVIEHFKRLIMHLNAPSDKHIKVQQLEFDHWNTLLANLEEIFNTLQVLLGWFKHIIVICHETTDLEREGDNYIVKDILPAIEGSMRNKVGKYFEEAYNTRARQVGKDVVYEVLTVPINKYMARTSRKLEPTEKADFKNLFKEEAGGEAKTVSNESKNV
jgi:energy-coupling factor transporter ATP-binding protein EcfA2